MAQKGNRLTLKEIIRLEPGVGRLLRSARKMTAYCDVCRMGLHRRLGDPPGYKQRIAELVGFRVELTDDRLRTQEAYEIVFDAIWHALPIVQECAFCGPIDDQGKVFALPRVGQRALRSEVWDKTNGHCWYCDKALNPFRDLHIDHVVPRARGGLDTIDNLVPACATCNLSKGAKSLDEWEGPRE